MKQYLELCQHVLKNGSSKNDRTNTGTYSTFGYQMRFDLQEGFPLLSTKKVFTKAVIHELLWFIKGDTNIKYLVDNNVRIWNEWAYLEFTKSNEYKNETIEQYIQKIKENEQFAKKHGDLGPVYGKQWRNWNGIDQLQNAINTIKTNPDSRRIIVSSWNPEEIDQMALPPCHSFFQFYVKDNKISLQLYQRSADIFLGVPFNIASYALLLEIVAKTCDLEVGEFIHTLGDAHIYSNHLEQINLQLSRDIRALPTLKFSKKDNIEDYQYEDFLIENYNPHPTIKGDVAV